MLSPSHSMVFLIFVRIVLYRRRKSGHHLGTKAVKIIVILSVLIYKKLSIFKAFHSSRPFNTTKTNTIFIIAHFLLPGKAPARGGALFVETGKERPGKVFYNLYTFIGFYPVKRMCGRRGLPAPAQTCKIEAEVF